MKNSRYLAVFVAALLAAPMGLLAQSKGGGSDKKQASAASDKDKAKEKEKAAEKSKSAEKDKKASPDASNKGGDTRAKDRALEAQKQGQGAEHRDFATPKGLSGDTSKEKSKDKKDEKSKDKDKEKSKEKSKDTKDQKNKDATEKEKGGKKKS